MTNAPAIEIKDLRKVYKKSKKAPEKVALKGVDLTIPRGSIFGLLGPNGAGKSTLINILAGLVNKTSGSAAICGYDIETQTRQARASIGIVPQEIAMDVFFTPFQALELQAGYYGVPKSERRSEEILAALGLADKRDAYVRQLSGGMKRRRQLWEYVQELHARGTTIILTTHYLEEAESLCDHIAIMHHGEIVANESKSSLMSRLDKRTLLITPTEPVTSLPATLENLDASVNKDGQIAINYRSGTDSISAMLAQVKAAGLSILDLRTEEPDLEEVFLSLTYGQDS